MALDVILRRGLGVSFVWMMPETGFFENLGTTKGNCLCYWAPLMLVGGS